MYRKIPMWETQVLVLELSAIIVEHLYQKKKKRRKKENKAGGEDTWKNM